MMIKDLSDSQPRARVFISCGQNKDSDEPTIAAEIKRRLEELGFDPYVAVGEISLRGLRETIFEQLDRSEYFLFVDFKRERLKGSTHRGSLFSHQELAVASYLEIDALAFREQGVKEDDGMWRAIQGNAIDFSEREKLPDLVTKHVKKLLKNGKWDAQWRNELVLEREPTQSVDIMDMTFQQMHRYFHINVRNRHRRKTALNCFAYLEKAISIDTREEISFKTFELKWEGYSIPNAHVTARKVRSFDAFCVRHDEPDKLRFYGFCDASYALPQIDRVGKYELTYLVVADNFPPAQNSFILSLGNSPEATTLVPNGKR